MLVSILNDNDRVKCLNLMCIFGEGVGVGCEG